MINHIKIYFTLLAITLFSINPIASQCQVLAKIKDLEQLLNNATKQKDDNKVSQYSYELANLYTDVKEYSKAIVNLEKNLQSNKRLGNNNAVYLAYQGIGIISVEQKKLNDALVAFEKGVKVARQLNNKLFEAEALVNTGKTNALSGHFKKSIEPIETALLLSVDLKNESLQLSCYSLLAEYYNKLGNSSKANTYLNQYNVIVRSHQNEALAIKQLNELRKQVDRVESEIAISETKLESQTQMLARVEDSLHQIEQVNLEKQMQIDLLNKDKELSQLKIKEQDAHIRNEQLWRNSIIIGILLAGGLVSVVIVDYRKKLETNKKINQQNQNIRNSINYAKRIQEAMLPKNERQLELVSDSFVLFKPRDTVSGDFYWFSEINNRQAGKELAFAAVDCTGHGVPGAFMSMVGMKSLNGIISQGIMETDQILNALHTEIRTALRQEETGNDDGMDVALCIYRKDRKILEFSGAKNPLVYIQNHELQQVKGDIHPIGGSKSKPHLVFKKHEIAIDKPTMVYLFSDGYRDQFGGKDNTKFMSKKFNRLLLEIHQLPMERQQEILNKTIEEWKGSGHQTDDILVMGIKLETV